MSTTTLVGLIVLAVVAGLALALVAVAVTRRRLTSMLAGQQVLRGPEIGSYRGATGDHHPRAAGDGALALTADRLIVARTFAHTVEVPLDAVTGVRVDTSRSARSGGLLVVSTDRGEISLRVRDVPAWEQAITAALPR